MQSDHFVCYNSAGLLKGKRRRDPTKEEGEKFLKYCVKSFEEKCGSRPDLVIVPDDYLGDDHVIEDVRIERGAKPRGHYYVGYSPQEL